LINISLLNKCHYFTLISERRLHMKGKVIFLMVALTALICFIGDSTAIMAGELPKNKLGYGFEKGLVAGKDYVSGQLIVGIKEGMDIQGISQAAQASGGTVVKSIKGAILLDFTSEQAAKDAVKKLIDRSDVTFVERNGFMSIPPIPTLPDIKGQQKKNLSKEDFNSSSISAKSVSAESMSALSVSTDPGTGYQWHHTVIRKTANLGTLSATPPTVAVIDTGVDYTHPDLSGKVILGKNCIADNADPFDDNGHGTHVAGIIAASSANGLYGEGVCPNCKILAIKVLGSDGTGTFFDVACGMENARTKVTTPATKVINMSLGGPSSTLVSTEVDTIKAAGKVLVAAAGNDNTIDITNAYPGADPDTALRVMATEENDCRTWFSNFSPAGNPTRYNIAAPGWEILSTLPEAGYGTFSGTSQATPIVAGAAALIWGETPSLTRDDLVSTIVNNGKSTNCGFAASTKRVDVRKAILLGTPETAIIGRMLDPFTGKAPSSPITPVTVKLCSDSTCLTPLASDQTNTSGFYEITGLTAAPGRRLKGNRTGYMNATVRTGITITSNVVAGPFTDALPKIRSTGDVTLTLDWKRTQPVEHTTGCIDTCNGWEFDLIVKLPSGVYITPYECDDSSCTTGDLMASPYVKNPRDSFVDYKPLETIVIGSSATDGVYMVIVDKWFFESYMFNPSWSGSLASVQKYNGPTSAGTYAPAYATCGLNEFWHVGNLTKTGTSYTWTSVNTCSDIMP
jgi:hypothetical protein